MPKTAFTAQEVHLLITSILQKSGRQNIDELLKHCHEYRSSIDPDNESLQPHEKYFRKEIVYRDFDLHIRHFLCDGDSVSAADMQFKRSSRFPSPFINRNRGLVSELHKLLHREYHSLGVTVKDADGGRQIHFKVSSNSFWWNASTPFEQWESECALYDEPYSSGQTDARETNIRNDFIIFRFRRKIV